MGKYDTPKKLCDLSFLFATPMYKVCLQLGVKNDVANATALSFSNGRR
jgi:hypothetical protein